MNLLKLCLIYFIFIEVKLIYAKDFPLDFEFGVSNASAQVEDQLNDSWMSFARSGRVKAFNNHQSPEDKIKFWSEPEVEIENASKLGVTVFRMSIDWSRLVPHKSKKVLLSELKQYKNMLKKLKEKNIKVMLTLFHHSAPQWVIDMGDWTNTKTIDYFMSFAKTIFDELNPLVDYWNTFNEANVYAMFTHVVGIWPVKSSSILNISNFSFYEGDFFKALNHMAIAHNKFYHYAHKKNDSAKISIAHNIANYQGENTITQLMASWAWHNMNYYFIEQIKDSLDYLGVNFYGAEVFGFTGIKFSNKFEYNDAGRAIDPSSFPNLLKDLYSRFKKPIFITENGTADTSDTFKSLYIIEHLEAIKYTLSQGIPIMGYIYWTLTDNFEWSDGYCPKFGLIKVDRSNFSRQKRKAYYDYAQIIKDKEINQSYRDKLWDLYNKKIGSDRTTCRHVDGKTALDKARKHKLKNINWRFNK